MSNDKDSELLIQLLDGGLPEPARQQLMQRLETDSALQTEWEELNLSRELLLRYGRKKQISAIHGEMMQERAAAVVRPMRGLSRYAVYAMRAAAAIGLIVLSATLFTYFSATPEKLFASRFELYTPSELRGDAGTAIRQEYRSGDLRNAIAGYRSGLSTGAQDDFLAGNAYLQTNNPAAAIQALLAAKKANQNGGTHFLEPETEYYLALAYLGAGQPKEALPLFSEIHADRANPYNEKVSWWFLQKVRRLAAK